jgi:hypothetical protein
MAAGFELTNCDDANTSLFRQILLAPIEEGAGRPTLACCDHWIRKKRNSVEKRLIRPKYRLRSRLSFFDRKCFDARSDP